VLLVKDSIMIEDRLIEVTPAKMARTSNAKSSGKKVLDTSSVAGSNTTTSDVSKATTSGGILGGLKPRQAGRGGRGRGGRGGIGSTRPSVPSAAVPTPAATAVVEKPVVAGEKTQDDFRAMLSK
jgi:hypothetical protein